MIFFTLGLDKKNDSGIKKNNTMILNTETCCVLISFYYSTFITKKVISKHNKFYKNEKYQNLNISTNTSDENEIGLYKHRQVEKIIRQI